MTRIHHHHRRAAIIGSIIAAALAVRVGADDATAIAKGGAAIRADDVREDIDFLASDELEGRNTPSAGLEVAARYLKTRHARLGEAPLDPERTWFQPWPIAREDVTKESGVALGAASFAIDGRDAAPLPGAADAEAKGDVVFVGYGISAPDLGWDDYAGIDVKGKIALALRYGPGHREPDEDAAAKPQDELVALEKKMRREETFAAKVALAKRRGAIALLLVTGARARRDDGFAMEFPMIGGLYEDFEAPNRRAESLGIPALHIARAKAKSALAFLDLDDVEAKMESSMKPASQPIDGARVADANAPADPLRATIRLARSVSPVTVKNVVALREGRDPSVKDELVVIGAHYDHIGRAGDEIYNGADDNASGTCALLAIARAFAATGPARRGIAFLHFSGEERGLLGSEHYCRHPLRPLERTIAMLNLDMVGRNAPLELEATGGAQSPLLDRLLDEANADPGVGFKLARPRALGTGSDHESFFARRVPSMFFFSGYHDDYHKPGDKPAKIDAAKIARAARLAFGMAWRLAEGDERPTILRPARPGKPRLY